MRRNERDQSIGRRGDLKKANLKVSKKSTEENPLKNPEEIQKKSRRNPEKKSKVIIPGILQRLWPNGKRLHILSFYAFLGNMSRVSHPLNPPGAILAVALKIAMAKTVLILRIFGKGEG